MRERAHAAAMMRLPCVVLLLLVGCVAYCSAGLCPQDSMGNMVMDAIRPQPPSPTPNGLIGMAMTAAPCYEKPEYECLFLFGGLDEDGSLHGNLWYYSTMHLWIVLDAASLQRPAPRFGSELHFWFDGEVPYLVMFGGLADQGSPLNDVWLFNFITKDWTPPAPTGPEPSPRFLYSSALLGDQLFVLDGLTIQEEHKLDFGDWIPVNDSTVYAFNLVTSSWVVFPTVGDAPRPRGGAAIIFTNSTLLIAGGAFLDDKGDLAATDQCWKLDLITGTWRAAPKLPLSIAYARGVYFKLFGTPMWIVSGGTSYPATVAKENVPPPASNSHSFALGPDGWNVFGVTDMFGDDASGPGRCFFGLIAQNNLTETTLYGGLRTFSSAFMGDIKRNYVETGGITLNPPDPNFAAYGLAIPTDAGFVICQGQSTEFVKSSRISQWHWKESEAIGFWSDPCRGLLENLRPRSGASLTRLPGPSPQYLMFGGFTRSPDSKYDYPIFPVLFVYNNSSVCPLLRSHYEFQGPAPPPRGFHVAGRIGSALYVLGGQSQNEIDLADAWRLDLSSQTWHNITSTLKIDEPCAIESLSFGGSAVLQSDPDSPQKIYTFSRDGQLCVFDPVGLSLTVQRLSSALKPPPLNAPGFVGVDGAALVVAGGYINNVEQTNAVWAYSVRSNQWITSPPLSTNLSGPVMVQQGRTLFLTNGITPDDIVFSSVFAMPIDQCPPGYSGLTLSECTLCPVGTYSSTLYDAACNACPPMLTTFDAGSTSANDCAACAPDACHGHGTCVLVQGQSGQRFDPQCDCDFFYKLSHNCAQPMLAVTVVSVLIGGALLLLVANLAVRRMRKLSQARAAAAKQLELEVEAHKRSWRINWQDLRFTDLLHKSGTFGDVRSAIWFDHTVVVKVLHTAMLAAETSLYHADEIQRIVQDFEQEIKLMPTLRHANVALFFGGGVHDGYPFLVMELLECGSLYDLLHDPHVQLSAGRKLRLALDGARGCAFLHAQNPPLIHRDIKSLNFLVSGDLTVKLSDFGSSKIFSQLQNGLRAPNSSSSASAGRSWLRRAKKSKAEELEQPLLEAGPDIAMLMTRNVGTPLWQAPELLEDGESAVAYDTAVDVYSYSIVMWEIMHRLDPYHESTNMFGLAEQVLGGRRPSPVEHPDAPAAYISIMQSAWSHDAAIRPDFPTIVAALEHLADSETAV
eukprot:m.239443 g.239443  ORF g.239443 m.239443 type:complete len:1190 (-) comp10917_c5_seq5:250-3819(-)